MSPPVAASPAGIRNPLVQPTRAWIAFDTNAQGFGLLCGCVLSICAAMAFAYARVGILEGMLASDLTMIRFSVAAVILLPVLLRAGVRDLAGVGRGRGLVMLLVGGPLFILPQAAGYHYAPLAHGGVIAPATVTVFSSAMAALFLHERLSRAHLIGVVMVIAGIVLISWHGLYATPGSKTWIGDLLFIGSSLLWGTFTVLMRAWRLTALRTIAVVSVLSVLVMAPFYLEFVGWAHLRSLPAGQVLTQAVTQGAMQGAVGLLAYSHSIRVLGVSRAVLFPASVPAVSVLMGIPILGEIPAGEQIAGLVLVTVGLLYAIGAFRIRRERCRAA